MSSLCIYDNDTKILYPEKTRSLIICDICYIHHVMMANIHVKKEAYEKRKPITDINNIKICSDYLSGLTLIGLDIINVKALAQLYKLEDLFLFCLNNLKSIKMLKKIKCIKIIGIEGCNKLKDISSLSKLSRKLYVNNYNCKNRFFLMVLKVAIEPNKRRWLVSRCIFIRQAWESSNYFAEATDSHLRGILEH